MGLIVEAKRSGKAFVLPDRAYPDAPVGFALLAQECREAESAMIQACGYAAGVGDASSQSQMATNGF